MSLQNTQTFQCLQPDVCQGQDSSNGADTPTKLLYWQQLCVLAMVKVIQKGEKSEVSQLPVLGDIAQQTNKKKKKTAVRFHHPTAQAANTHK